MTQLERLEHKKPLSEEAVKGIARMLLRGVAFLHEHRVVHRDLKPPNMLMELWPASEGCFDSKYKPVQGALPVPYLQVPYLKRPAIGGDLHAEPKHDP